MVPVGGRLQELLPGLDILRQSAIKTGRRPFFSLCLVFLMVSGSGAERKPGRCDEPETSAHANLLSAVKNGEDGMKNLPQMSDNSWVGQLAGSPAWAPI